MSGNGTYPGRSVVSKFSAILMTFRQGGSHRLNEISALSGLPISTTHRMVHDLSDWLLLEKDGDDDRRYRPGAALRSLANDSICAPASASSRDLAAPWLEDLHRTMGADVRIGILKHGAVRYIEKRRSSPVSQPFPVATLPAHATAMGKALLAYASPNEVTRVLSHRLSAYTSWTVTDPEQFKQILKKTRWDGYAVAERELRPDHCALAAPVFGANGHIVAALELDVQDLAVDMISHRPALLIAAAGLSRELERPCRISHEQLWSELRLC